MGGSPGGGIIFPKDMDREDFAERRRIGADYLARMARGSAEQRRDLLLEWAVKLYDGHAGRRVALLDPPGNIGQLVADLRLYYSGTIVPLVSNLKPSCSTEVMIVDTPRGAARRKHNHSGSRRSP